MDGRLCEQRRENLLDVNSRVCNVLLSACDELGRSILSLEDLATAVEVIVERLVGGVVRQGKADTTVTESASYNVDAVNVATHLHNSVVKIQTAQERIKSALSQL